MPTQNIHLLKNPHDTNWSPWFEIEGSDQLENPEWNFTQNQLKSWQKLSLKFNEIFSHRYLKNQKFFRADIIPKKMRKKLSTTTLS